MFKYRALSNGTLNNPYRFVEAGQIVESETPIEAKWLRSLDLPPLPELPITSAMNYAGSKIAEVLVAPVNPNAQYDAGIQSMRALENKMDAAAGKPLSNPTLDPALEAAKSALGETTENTGGTGNQDAI